jgi:hypothetical protein
MREGAREAGKLLKVTIPLHQKLQLIKSAHGCSDKEVGAPHGPGL